MCLQRLITLATPTLAIALRSDDPDLYNDRGDFYVKLGSLDEALSAYEKAISLNRDYALGHSNRGWVLAIKEEHADAITAYGEALRIVHFQVFVIMEL